jgi:hypothetical protein
MVRVHDRAGASSVPSVPLASGLDQMLDFFGVRCSRGGKARGRARSHIRAKHIRQHSGLKTDRERGDTIAVLGFG